VKRTLSVLHNEISIGESNMDIVNKLVDFIKAKRLIVIVALIVIVVSVTIALAVLNGGSTGGGANGAAGAGDGTSGGAQYEASAEITIAVPEGGA
jgi:hypothetical protein